MICPKCASENCHFVSQTNSSSGSFCDGCCGFLIFGPIGILCGLCGSDTNTKEYWICDNCGCKFQRGLARKTVNEPKTQLPPKYESTKSSFAYYVSNNNQKFCKKCGKPLNAIGKCNFCEY